MTDETSAIARLLDRIDNFATQLTSAEQHMFHTLLSDDDTAGFSGTPWPGVRSIIAPIKIEVLGDDPISSGDLGSGRFTGGPDLGSPRSK